MSKSFSSEELILQHPPDLFLWISDGNEESAFTQSASRASQWNDTWEPKKERFV